MLSTWGGFTITSLNIVKDIYNLAYLVVFLLLYIKTWHTSLALRIFCTKGTMQTMSLFLSWITLAWLQCNCAAINNITLL